MVSVNMEFLVPTPLNLPSDLNAVDTNKVTMFVKNINFLFSPTGDAISLTKNTTVIAIKIL